MCVCADGVGADEGAGVGCRLGGRHLGKFGRGIPRAGRHRARALEGA